MRLTPFFYDINPVMVADGYKLDHRRQYPRNTQVIQSNWTARGSRIPGLNTVPLIFLQGAIRTYLMDALKPFFEGPVDPWLKRYQRRLDLYLGSNDIGTDHIRDWHRLGYTPLSFHALPEGTHVPLRVPQFIVDNTLDEFYWMTNYYESLLSATIWGPSTSAGQAYRMRRMLEHHAIATGCDPEFTWWQGHDFSFRGMFGLEAAILSGIGHLAAFRGTDSLPAIDAIEYLYPGTNETTLAGSVPATEHSVMCVDGNEGERETFERILDLYPAGIVSIVSDTWDFFKVVTEIVPSLRDKILARNGKLVLRPDSGDPVKIVCGDPNATPGTPQHKGAIELLWETFGGTTTATGHKLLDSHLGLIYGDAITYTRADAILAGLARKGFASANVVFGVGSFTYQYVTRDLFNFAMKATYAKVDGEDRSLFKKPATDDGMKFSAKGRLAVVQDAAGQLQLINEATPEQEQQSLLREIWRDGQFLIEENWDVIRQRLLSV